MSPEGQHREAEVLESLGLGADRFPEQVALSGNSPSPKVDVTTTKCVAVCKFGDVDLVEFDGLGLDADGFEVSANVMAASSALPISVP